MVPLLYMPCILAGISSGSFATPAQYEYKFVVMCRNMMYLICTNRGLRRYTLPRPWLIQIKYITPTCATSITLIAKYNFSTHTMPLCRMSVSESVLICKGSHTSSPLQTISSMTWIISCYSNATCSASAYS